MGICHGSDLVFVSGAPFMYPMDGYTTRDMHFSAQVMKLWTNFAKYGRPDRVDVRALIDYYEDLNRGDNTQSVERISPDWPPPPTASGAMGWPSGAGPSTQSLQIRQPFPVGRQRSHSFSGPIHLPPYPPHYPIDTQYGTGFVNQYRDPNTGEPDWGRMRRPEQVNPGKGPLIEDLDRRSTGMGRYLAKQSRLTTGSGQLHLSGQQDRQRQY
ncbi:unnamed protein product, partial [Medioppia subpectinata]